MKLVPKGKVSNYVGIEIEFVSDRDVHACNVLLRKLRMDRWCNAASDSSIEDDEGYQLPSHYDDLNDEDVVWGEGFGVELRVLSTEKDLSDKLRKVKWFLKRVDATVNSSCGLHVHLDMRKRNLQHSTLKLLSRQSEFRKMVPWYRQDSIYCQPLSIDHLYQSDILGRKKFVTYMASRTDINVRAYEKHKTLEVRMHEGTLDMKEILSWSNYLIAIVNGKEDSIDKRYVQKRIEEHA